ncbi:MAG: pyridoxamine 5'-phosphate oxidase family protein [Lachnospiraceae bacterium]|nr:pyridoxamine 5'-phosphate oxidase family protein [Lachnospiraceae bacterium]
MRRKDREVTDISKMMEIMNSCDCCRLGLVDGKEAYIVPMNFGYDRINDQITLYFHCAAEGRKIDLLPGQSVVSFEMDTKHRLIEGKRGCDFSWLYQCIMGTGTLEIVSDANEKIDGLQKIMEHYTKKTQWEFDERVVERINVLKLSVRTWSCKEH